MTNFILVNEKRGHRIDIYQMQGKEEYVIIDSFRLLKDSPIIPDTKTLDDIITELINNDYEIFQGLESRGDIEQ